MAPVDILLFGANGFTGRLVARYLAAHPQRAHFTLGITGRSHAKLDALAADLGLDESVQRFVIDLADVDSIAAVVKQARVVINTVGPFWRYGTPVVAACVANGVHYTGLAVETAWIRDLIDQFDGRARANGTVVIPSSGLESVPSDISAYLSSKAVKEIDPAAAIESSTTSFQWKGGISGGTLASFLAVYDDIPQDKQVEAAKPYALSPIEGAPRPESKWIYSLPHTPTVGGTLFLSPANKANVEMTWGLLEEEARANAAAGKPVASRSYGPHFAYSEFLQTGNSVTAFATSVVYGAAFGLAARVKAVRSVLTTLLPAGSGPSESAMAKGYMIGTNVSTTAPRADGSVLAVKGVLKCHGDPGYTQTAVMVSEAALGLLLDHASLPSLGQRGGLLTPVAALGDVLLKRLEATGTFEFEYGRLVEEGGKKQD